MKIMSLSDISIRQVLDCFFEAFADYSIKMTSDQEYWMWRFRQSRVDFGKSYGMFDNNKLVGFILHGIDEKNGRSIAYNAGTGVLPAYRGRGIVDKLYEQSFEDGRRLGVDHFQLEVLTDNARAIRVYERIGFTKKRRLGCYQYNPTDESTKDLGSECEVDEILKKYSDIQQLYAWDFDRYAIQQNAGEYAAKCIDDKVGIIYHPERNMLVQVNGIDVLGPQEQIMAMRKINAHLGRPFKINNVDSSRRHFMEALQKTGWQFVVDQYEMSMKLAISEKEVSTAS